MSNKFLDLSGLSRYKEKSDEELNALLSAKANKDGYYQQLTAGHAENLIDTKGRGTEQEFTRRTSCGDESISDDGAGIIQEVRGNSVVWNQLVHDGDFLDSSAWVAGKGSVSVSNGTLTYTGDSTAATAKGFRCSQTSYIIEGHKYLVLLDIKASDSTSLYLTQGFASNTGFWQPFSVGTTMETRKFFATGARNYNGYISIRWDTSANQGGTLEARSFNIIDLTLMFGVGHEPSTVAEFEALYHELYYPYNAGAIINNAAETLVTNGFNQWDEEWEAGSYNDDTGLPIDSNIYIRSKNAIRVFPSTTYYKKGIVRVFYYDISGNYINHTDSSPNVTFTTPANCYYIRIRISYAAPYQNDICINLSWSGYRNGEYEPYWKRETGVDMRKLYGKLNGQGEMVQVFPAGGRSAGDVFDLADPVRKEADVRVGSVDLGTLTWTKQGGLYFQSGVVSDFKSGSDNYGTSKYVPGGYMAPNSMSTAAEKVAYRASGMILIKDSAYSDAASFKAAMNGVELVYELATPLHYTDLMYSEDGGETFVDIPTVFKVADFGTESIVPLIDNQGNPTTAPFRAVIAYSTDFTREIVNLPKKYDSTAGIDGLCSALSSALSGALNGTFVVARGAYDEATKKYAFTASFTPNSE